MKKEESLEAFSEMPVPQAVMKNAIPAMIAMLMVLIFMAVGTIFGIGGTSVISRAIGEGRTEYAKKVCSYAVLPVVRVSAGVCHDGSLLSLYGSDRRRNSGR